MGQEKASDLWVAAKEGDVDTITRIFRDVETTVNVSENGATPLWIASKHGHTDVVRALVDAADVDWTNEDSETALYAAAQEGHVHVVDVLVRYANVNLANADGATPLYIASEMGHADVVERLLQHDRVDANLSNRNGATALHIASERGHAAAVALLLPRTNAALQDMDGWTALHAAAYSGQAKVVELLAASGLFDATATTKGGDSAVDLATEEGYVDVARLLRQVSSMASPASIAIPPMWPCLWLVEPTTGYHVYPKKWLSEKWMRLRPMCPHVAETAGHVVRASSASIRALLPFLRTTLQFLTATALLAEHPTASVARPNPFLLSVLDSAPIVVPALVHAVAAMSFLHNEPIERSNMEKQLEQLVAALHDDVDVATIADDLNKIWAAYEVDPSSIKAHKDVLLGLPSLGHHGVDLDYGTAAN
ncbi:hypothetical protein, variant [Aphanomyces invadans]|uniref:Uncharacterized protein n=1 Tax=Aphanomyces invadans TaxID=157072 RepID=A0A024TJL1_9STRA|nr:hypothetical protein, variant [Aphanomyces invadans]ETV93796.1 hypothetical protein, variant [Aphanomyces invadans]|eukprot:XP_008877604.1 hypothetical protein, variant [Aphanomyces invadans]